MNVIGWHNDMMKIKKLFYDTKHIKLSMKLDYEVDRELFKLTEYYSS